MRYTCNLAHGYGGCGAGGWIDRPNVYVRRCATVCSDFHDIRTRAARRERAETITQRYRSDNRILMIAGALLSARLYTSLLRVPSSRGRWSILIGRFIWRRRITAETIRSPSPVNDPKRSEAESHSRRRCRLLSPTRKPFRSYFETSLARLPAVPRRDRCNNGWEQSEEAATERTRLLLRCRWRLVATVVARLSVI